MSTTGRSTPSSSRAGCGSRAVYCEVVAPWVSTEEVQRFAPGALILSGGPASVHAVDAPRINEAILDLGIPVLGICYGMQLLAQHLGGQVEPAADREYGRANLEVQDDPLFEGVPATSTVWMSHGDRVERIPEGFRVIGTSTNSPYAAVRAGDRPVYGLQFHPEVVHSEFGTRILRNFLLEISGLEGDWSMEAFITSEIDRIRETIGDATVICGVSGGVDSTVVAALMHRALGDQVQCFCIDNGVLRLDEQDEIVKIFEQDLKIPLRMIDESDRFLSRLRGIDEPEKKRVTIGHTFVEVFEEAARSYTDARFLAQGDALSRRD